MRLIVKDEDELKRMVQEYGALPVLNALRRVIVPGVALDWGESPDILDTFTAGFIQRSLTRLVDDCAGGVS